MIHFVVPAFNEEANIARQIDEISAFLKKHHPSYRLVVVDDGSRDRTAEKVLEKARELPCELVSYKPNRGVDEAFRKGFLYVLPSVAEGDVIVTSEADGTADLSLLPEFISRLKEGDGLVVASYYAEGGAVQGTVWHRKILSRCGNGFLSAVFRLKGIHTYSSFFRAYKPAALRAVLKRHGDFFAEKGFSCVVELLVRIHRLGYRVSEVPMKLDGSQRVGRSKMKVFQTIAGYLRIAARSAFARAQ